MGERQHATHQPRETTGNRKTKPRAAMAPRGRGVPLFELLENRLARRLRHARPCVPHFDTQSGAVMLQTNAHAAFLGKIDRIADEVDQNLAQPRGIADQLPWRLWRDEAGDLQPLFLCAGAQKLQHAFDEWREREGLASQFELAGLDFRKIENVIDELGERPAGGRDGLDITRLLRVEARHGEELGQTHDAIERRPDFMADGGKEA